MKRIFYYLVKYLLRYYNHIYFKNIEVYGYENIPKDGGVLFSPNHQGAFLDPLIIGSMTPNRITSLTRSDVFGGPFQWFLDSFQMLPVYRIRNGYSNLKKNDLTFAKCYKLLSEGKFMLMFSEGGHHDEYYLQNLSKGSSRLAYQAQQLYPDKKIYLQPVGINYGHHRQPRCTLHLVFEEPIELGAKLNSNLNEAENINNLKNLLQERMKNCLWLPTKTENYPLQKKKINRFTTQLPFAELKDALQNNAAALRDQPQKSSFEKLLGFLLSVPNLIPLLITRFIISKFEDVVFISSLKYAMGVFFFPIWWFFSSMILAYFFGNTLMLWYLLICIFSIFARQRFLLS